MKIIGCDFHPSYQQVAMLDRDTGEVLEFRLEHEKGEARRFYERLQGPVRVGMEAVGNSQWFEQMLAALGHELWIGDAGEIRRLEVRRQKTDRRDAQHILDLLRDGRFPRLWVLGQFQILGQVPVVVWARQLLQRPGMCLDDAPEAASIPSSYPTPQT